MKKSILFAGLIFVSAMFVGCTSDGTPATSSTKLWPAAVVSKDDKTGEQTAKWGYIDAKGQMIVAAAYDKAYEFSCGFAKLVSYNEQREETIYFINEKQEMQTIPSNDGLGDYFYYDYVKFKMSGNLWGLFDNKFSPAIQPANKDLGEMSNDGLVYFKQSADSKYGYLDKNGEPKIQAQYDDADDFMDGYAVVKMGSNYGVINKKGGQAVNYQANQLFSIGEERFGFYDKSSHKFGFMGVDNKVIVQAIYDAGSRYGFTDEGLIAVKQNKKWGYIDKNGKVKIQMQYYEASPFFGGMAWIKRDEKSNYEAIDSKGGSKITLGKNEVPLTFFRQGLCLIEVRNEAEGENSASYEYKYIDEKNNPIYSWKWEGYSSGAKPAGYATSNSGNGGYQGGVDLEDMEDLEDLEDILDELGLDEDEGWPEDMAPSNKMDINRLMAPTRFGNRARK